MTEEGEPVKQPAPPTPPGAWILIGLAIIGLIDIVTRIVEALL